MGLLRSIVEGDAPLDAMISLNMVHIAPWEAALGLLAGAGRLLGPDGVLSSMGPSCWAGHTRRRPTRPSTRTSRGGTRAGACVT
jgi:hypothetical protein